MFDRAFARVILSCACERENICTYLELQVKQELPKNSKESETIQVLPRIINRIRLFHVANRFDRSGNPKRPSLSKSLSSMSGGG
jgi:hypothetical protein